MRRFAAHLPIGEHPNDGEPAIADFDGLSDGVVSREETGAHAIADNGHFAPLCDLRSGEDLAFHNIEIHQSKVGRIDADDFSRPPVPLSCDQCVHHHFGTRRFDIRNDGANRLGVEIGQAGREFTGLLGVGVFGLLFFLLDNWRDNDIVRAKEPHLIENLAFGAFANGEHRNDGRYTKQNSE